VTKATKFYEYIKNQRLLLKSMNFITSDLYVNKMASNIIIVYWGSYGEYFKNGRKDELSKVVRSVSRWQYLSIIRFCFNWARMT
jgi:hypothetical protein